MKAFFWGFYLRFKFWSYPYSRIVIEYQNKSKNLEVFAFHFDQNITLEFFGQKFSFHFADTVGNLVTPCEFEIKNYTKNIHSFKCINLCIINSDLDSGWVVFMEQTDLRLALINNQSRVCKWLLPVYVLGVHVKDFFLGF